MQSCFLDRLRRFAIKPDRMRVFLTRDICRDGDGELIRAQLFKERVAKRLILKRGRTR